MNLKKRRMATFVAIAVIITIVGIFVINLPESTEVEKQKKETTQRISLWDPDYETDIFTLQRWLSKNRYLTYKNGGVSITITNGRYSEYGDTVDFMAKYFDALMHGDANLVNSFYSKEYFEKNKPFENITMQKIYDMTIEFLKRTDSKVNGINATIYVYRVTYKILENDGTFRNDLVSDAEKAQFYSIVDYGSKMEISDVSYVFPN